MRFGIRSVLLFLWIYVCVPAFGQPAAPVSDFRIPEPSIRVAVLPDSGYKPADVFDKTQLPFQQIDSIGPRHGDRFWIRILVRYPEGNAQSYRLKVIPNLSNTVYERFAGAPAATARQMGLNEPDDGSREKNSVRLRFLAGGTDTVLLLMQLPEGRRSSLKPQVSIEPEADFQAREADIRLLWTVAMSILVLLLVLNTCVYFGFRDRAILPYLPVQLGAMAFVTAARRFFQVLLPAKPFSLKLLPGGVVYYYNLNGLLMHLGVLLMMFGVVQFSRRYLDLQRILPRHDRWLRRLLLVYGGAVLLATGLSLAGYYVDLVALYIENVLVFGIVCGVLYAGGAAYRRNRPVATTFLIASAVPVTLVLALALLHLVVHNGAEGPMLPYLAIISQAICFFLMILARIRQLIDEVAFKRREAGQLAAEIRAIEAHRAELLADHTHILEEISTARARHAKAALQNSALLQQLAEDSEQRGKLETQLAANQRELASTSLQLLQKNELLASLRSEIDELGKGAAGNTGDLKTVSSMLQHDLYLDQDWNKFKVHFEQVHPGFFTDLAARHPGLTRNEIRLFTYFHMNLSTKEIAALLNIEPGSVRRAKTRLYKKLGRNDDDPLASAEQLAGNE